MKAKRASLAPKVMTGMLSNVKDSFYLIDHSVIKKHTDRTQWVSSQITQMKQSKLYGKVVVLCLQSLP
jgi:hypothetical protein